MVKVKEKHRAYSRASGIAFNTTDYQEKLNQSAAALAANPVFHARCKHIEIDLHFLRDQILAKQLSVRYVPSLDQAADILTKPLTTDRFNYLKSKLQMASSPFRLRGDVNDITVKSDS